MLRPLVFIVGLIFGLKRWPAVLAFVVTWPLLVLFMSEDPPGRIGAYCLVVLGNAAAAVAIHEIAAACRRTIYSVVRTHGRRRAVGNSI